MLMLWFNLSLVQFLFSFANNRIAKCSLAKKTVLVTHDNLLCVYMTVENRSWSNSIIQTFVLVFTPLKADGLNI